MTQGKDWNCEYVGAGKKKVVVTPQVKALRERARKGLGPATSALTAQRVGIIADLMRKDEWCRDKKLELRDAWGLSTSRVEQISAEASRWTAAEVTDVDAVTINVAETLSRKLRQADELSTIAFKKAKILGAKNEVTASVMKDAALMFSAIERTADTWTKVVGARAPDKDDHTKLVAQFDQLPYDKKIEWLDERIDRMVRAKQALIDSRAVVVQIEEIQSQETNKQLNGNGIFHAEHSNEEGPGSTSE